jgi:hypothetical protein
MNVHKSELIIVDLDEDNARLSLKCLGDVLFEEFKDCLEKALYYADKHHIKQWLLDFTAIGNLDEEHDAWLQTYLYPKIMMQLGSSNYVAIVLSDKCYGTLYAEAGMSGLKSYNSYIIINTFCEMNLAIDWLNKHHINKAS